MADDREEYLTLYQRAAALAEATQRGIRKATGYVADLTPLGPMADEATRAATLFYPKETELGGEADAMRHMLFQSEVANRYGQVPAKAVGLLNEYVRGLGQSSAERRMDLANDALGREVGASGGDAAERLRRIVEMIDAGKATTIDETQMNYAEGGSVDTGTDRLLAQMDAIGASPAPVEPDPVQQESQNILSRLNTAFSENISKPVTGSLIDMTVGLGDLAQMGTKYLAGKAGIETKPFAPVSQRVQQAAGVEGYDPYSPAAMATQILPFARPEQAVSTSANMLSRMFPNLGREATSYLGGELAAAGAREIAPDSVGAELLAGAVGSVAGSTAATVGGIGSEVPTMQMASRLPEPTPDKPFVGGLDRRVAAMGPEARTKEQMINTLAKDSRAHEKLRLERALADIPEGALVRPDDVLERLNKTYDPSDFRVNVYGGSGKPVREDLYESMDNPWKYRGSGDSATGPMGVLTLNRENLPEEQTLMRMDGGRQRLVGDQQDRKDLMERLEANKDDPVLLATTLIPSWLTDGTTLDFMANVAAPLRTAQRHYMGYPKFKQTMEELSGTPLANPQKHKDILDKPLDRNMLQTINYYIMQTGISEFKGAIKNKYRNELGKISDLIADIELAGMDTGDISVNLGSLGQYATDPAGPVKQFFDLVKKVKDDPSDLTMLENNLNEAADRFFEEMPKEIEAIDKLINYSQRPGSNPKYAGQHRYSSATGNEIAFARFTPVEAQVMTMTDGPAENMQGIYVHELQSDLLDDLRKTGMRGETAETYMPKLYEAQEELNTLQTAYNKDLAKFNAEFFRQKKIPADFAAKIDAALEPEKAQEYKEELDNLAYLWAGIENTREREGNAYVNAFAKGYKERLSKVLEELAVAEGVSIGPDNYAKKIDRAQKKVDTYKTLTESSPDDTYFSLDEAFPGMRENSKATQQMMMKAAINAAQQEGKSFVAFPGAESAQAQLYVQPIPRNAKDVIKDLGPGYTLQNITLHGDDGPFSVWAIVWGQDAANRTTSEGMKFAKGGEVKKYADGGPATMTAEELLAQMDAIGTSPEKVDPVQQESQSILDRLKYYGTGTGEALLTMATAIPSSVPAGLRGLYETATTPGSMQTRLRAGADIIPQQMASTTYLPRTMSGREALQSLEALAVPSEAIGRTALEATGSPLAGTLAETFLDPLELLGPALKTVGAVAPIVGKVAGHSLDPQLLVPGTNAAPEFKVVQSFTPKNKETTLSNIDAIEGAYPDPLATSQRWMDAQAAGFGGEYLPAPPRQALVYRQDPAQLAGMLDKLTPDLKAAVDEGFGYVNSIKNIYNSRLAPPETTGRLFLWGILSRGAGPAQQEGAFLDVMQGAAPFIDKAARGTFTEADLDAWKQMVARSIPEGSPGKQVTMNANAAGNLLYQLGQSTDGGPSPLTQLHNILSDPQRTGQEFRRSFYQLTNNPGIDNKVVSFIGLVAGKDDLLVMDRIQSRHLWDDGTYGGTNIYDGLEGGGLNKILTGPRGLMVTEMLENGLSDTVQKAYAMVGRPQDASLGRMHWETWLIAGNQPVSHSTLQAVRGGNPIGYAVTEGKRNTLSSNMTYRQAINGPIVEYPLSTGEIVRMTPTRQKEFEAFIRDKKNGIIPKGFKVSESIDKPWFEQPGVDRRKLDEAARQFENANPDGSLRSGDARDFEGRGTLSERRAQFLSDFRRDRLALAKSTRGVSGGADGPNLGEASGPYTRETLSTDGRDGLLTFSPDQNTLTQYQSASLSLPVIRQVDSAANAAAYNADMTREMASNPMGAQVEIKSPEELANARLFRTESGSGFAIKPDGDIVAVFASSNEPRRGSYAMLQAAVQAGGKKLDAFATYLPDIYESVGFRPVARLPWNDEFAPPNWDKNTFREYNNGEPDILFFVHDPEYFGGAKNIPYAKDYDDAVRIQTDELNRPSGGAPPPVSKAKGGSVQKKRGNMVERVTIDRKYI